MRSELIRLAIVQTRLAPFRVPFFERLASVPGLEVTVFSSAYSRENSRLTIPDSSPFRHRPLATTMLAGGACTIQWGLPRAVLTGRFHVVVAEARLGLVFNPLLLLLCRATGKRFLWWTCGWERSEMEAISSFKRAVRSLLFRCAHGGIAYSTVAAQYLTRLGMKPDRVWVAHNSLDTDALLAIEQQIRANPNWETELRQRHEALGSLLVLFVGKLTAPKGVDLLLRAFAEVRRREPTALLWIVGDGPERRRLEELAGSLRLEAVRFFGEITEPIAINSLYLAADVFALPGSGGLALNQAMTFGKCVVVSRADGTEEDLVTDGVSGLYFQPGNEADLASKLLLALQNTALRARIGEQARAHIRQHINMTNMIRSFHEAVLDQRPLPS